MAKTNMDSSDGCPWWRTRTIVQQKENNKSWRCLQVFARFPPGLAWCEEFIDFQMPGESFFISWFIWSDVSCDLKGKEKRSENFEVKSRVCHYRQRCKALTTVQGARWQNSGVSHPRFESTISSVGRNSFLSISLIRHLSVLCQNSQYSRNKKECNWTWNYTGESLVESAHTCLSLKSSFVTFIFCASCLAAKQLLCCWSNRMQGILDNGWYQSWGNRVFSSMRECWLTVMSNEGSQEVLGLVRQEK